VQEINTMADSRAAELNTELSIIDFIDLYNQNKIKLDLSFQRQACWKESSKRNYIEGILKGDFAGAFLLAKIPNQQRDVYETYFDELQKEGYEYVSIDGNNRTVALAEFLSDKFSVCPPQASRVVRYSDLSDVHKAKFKKPILLVEYRGISQAECSEIFINHNESEKLRHQELRNAIIAPISKFVRELELKIREDVCIFDRFNKYRRNDEFILDVMSYQLNYKDCTDKSRRDAVWSQYSDMVNFDSSYLIKTLSTVDKFTKFYEYGKKASSAVVRDYAILRGILFIKQYGEVTSDLQDTFIRSLAIGRKELYQCKELITLEDPDRTQMSYAHIASLPVNSYAFKARVGLLENLLKNVIVENNIKFVTPRSKLTQKVEVRHQLWKEQNMLCSVTGKQILDFLDGDLWHVDHIVPLAKGGTDSIENMQLICAKANLKKGAA